ncbi:ABC transporter ATP-binding protein [Nitrospirales bacterium NOB]|nr:ABC transporter ATP-binding protein [Nitrospirales bacterium NOB]
MLALDDVYAGYGTANVLFGVSLEVARGEVVALLGRNGMGKTTTISALMGMIPVAGGSITLDGEDIGTLPDYRRAKLGLGLVPEGRRIFRSLSVRENLQATARTRGEPAWTFDRILDLFPRLAERLSTPAGYLSGGEQQMLAIGRALMTNPWLLILDEATEGLAPLICEHIWLALRAIRGEGQSILLIDKNISAVVEISDRCYVLEKGRIVQSIQCDDRLADAAALSEALL